VKLGIITFDDGRKRVAEANEKKCFEFQHAISEWLRSEGHEVIEGEKIVWNWETTRLEAERVSQCDVVIFNFSVWSYPDLTVQAASFIDAPLLLMGNINPAAPGWVAFFCSAGSLDEVERPYGRALGNITDTSVQEDIRNFLKNNTPQKRISGFEAANALYGMRYGEFDGPSMGMYTGHVDQSQWMSQFGIHVYHRSQLTLVELMKRIPDKRVQSGLDWLEKHTAEIHWD